MKNQGLTIFLLFFGISLLDAFVSGHWARALFWLGIGVLFFAMDHFRNRSKAGHGHRHTM